jgi:uncharacterized protein (DUF1919 family)
MKSEHTIVFSQEGTARCLWTEVLPLGELGRLEVERASAVEFNDSTQKWEVRLASNPEEVAFTDASRQTCLDWEKDTINERL